MYYVTAAQKEVHAVLALPKLVGLTPDVHMSLSWLLHRFTSTSIPTLLYVTCCYDAV